MIDNVVAALGLGLNLTDEEIADVLWLAVQIQQFGDGIISEQGDRNEALENSVSNRESPKQPAQPLRDADRDRQDENKEDDQNFEVHSKNAQGDDRSTRRSDELQLKIPDARSLQKPLELARSLRPLMRRVPSQVNTLLDEEATVRRIAEEKIWCPVLRPALEPWLDLALVIDDSASMLMWRHTIAELQHFLSSYGVFRDVRVWRLGTDKAEKVCIYAGATASDRNGSPRSPSELIEANGRGLVLVVSDCIAPIWRNGAIANALQIWSRSGMAAILQMLPDWLWGRTALGRGVAAQFSALAAGIPNYQLTTTTVSTWYDIDLATSIKIPVVTLEPEKFTAWADMLAGKGGAWSAGIVFEPELFAVPEVAIEFDGVSELDAEDRVQSFRLTASPIARRLAGLLAAAPVISLPIVRILQSTVLTQSQPVHVAEVFLGGLLKPLSEITAKTNPNYVQYDFIEGVRDLLLESVPSSEIVNIVAEVSEYIANRLGISLEEFGAIIRNPRQVENTELVSQTRPFATLTAQILKQLGGEYVRFAEEVERANANPIQITINQASKFTHQVRDSLPAYAPNDVIVIGERATGKTSMFIQLILGGTSHVKVDAESIAAKYANLSNDIAPTITMQEESLVMNVYLPTGERKLLVTCIDTPGEAFSRNAWRSAQPNAWQAIQQKISKSNFIIVLLPPYLELIRPNLLNQSDEPCNLGELPTSNAWVRGIRNWLDFLTRNCNRRQHILICLHKADLICDVDVVGKRWRYSHASDRSWYEYNNYVKNIYFGVAKEVITEFSRNKDTPNLSFFLTTTKNKYLLELPWVYLSFYLAEE
jgi:hypothetical protein